MLSRLLAADDKATIDFVGWGGLGATQNGGAMQDEGEGLDEEPGQTSFDLAAEIDALPAQSGAGDFSAQPEVDAAPLEAESA